MVHPRDGEGHSWTLHRNYLLPISPNIEQDEKDAPMVGVESTNTSTPVPPLDSEPADAGLSGTVKSSAAGNTPQGSPDQPTPLRHGAQKPRSNSCGGTGILVCWQLPAHLASGMDWLVCASVSMSYPACTPFSGKVHCEYTLLIPSHVCQTPLILALKGIPSM